MESDMFYPLYYEKTYINKYHISMGYKRTAFDLHTSYIAPFPKLYTEPPVPYNKKSKEAFFMASSCGGPKGEFGKQKN
jgi:hypothetical protein